MSQNPTDESVTELVTPAVASAKLGVTVRSLARLADRGSLHPVVLPSGHRRYDRAEVEALAGVQQ